MHACRVQGPELAVEGRPDRAVEDKQSDVSSRYRADLLRISRANPRHIRYSRPDSGRELQVKVLKSSLKLSPLGLEAAVHPPRDARRRCISNVWPLKVPPCSRDCLKCGELLKVAATYKTVRARLWPCPT